MKVQVAIQYLNNETKRKFGFEVNRKKQGRLIECIDGDYKNPVIHSDYMERDDLHLLIREWINTGGIDPTEYRGADYGND